MVDIFKSAIDAAFGAGSSSRIANNIPFQGGTTASASAAGATTGLGGTRSDFTGQIVDVGNIRLRVGNQIAEGEEKNVGDRSMFAGFLGGYALVFLAYDVKTNKEYALKVNPSQSLSNPHRLLFQRLFAADDSAKKVISQEIAFLVSPSFSTLSSFFTVIRLAKAQWSRSYRSVHRCSVDTRHHAASNGISFSH